MEIGSALFRIVLLYGGIIGVCIALIVFFRARGRKQAQEKRRARKEALQPAMPTAGDTPSLASLMDAGGRADDRRGRAVYQAETGDDDSGLDDLFSGEYKPHTPADAHASDDSITADDDFEIDDDLDIAELVSAIDAAEAETTSADTPHTIGDRPLTIQLSDGTRTQAIEAMSILRDERDGRLIVQMSDTGYRTLRHNKTVRKAFARLMKELAQSVKQADDLSDTPPASDTPAQAPTPPPAQPANPQASPQRDAADDALPGDLPEYRLSEMETNYKRNRYGQLEVKEVQKVEEVNIADAIEAYLQHKISQTPHFQKRGIHVRPALIGVTIEADGQTYDSVDAVDDEDVKTFLKETIAEWQERNSRR